MLTCPSCGRAALAPTHASSGRVLWVCDCGSGEVYSGADPRSLRLEVMGGRRSPFGFGRRGVLLADVGRETK